MTTVIDHPRRGYRTIRLALAEADYARLMSDGEFFARAQLDQRYSRHPELFPEAWGRGYAWCGFTEPSRQQEGLRCRRVRLTAGEGVFAVAPAWVMPDLTASVAEVEKARLLMRFQVPCWALAQVFGRDALFGYRLEQGLGRFSVVGTTVKAPERLPVAAREHNWGTTTIPSFWGHKAVALMQVHKNVRFSGTDPYCSRQTRWVLFRRLLPYHKTHIGNLSTKFVRLVEFCGTYFLDQEHHRPSAPKLYEGDITARAVRGYGI